MAVLRAKAAALAVAAVLAGMAAPGLALARDRAGALAHPVHWRGGFSFGFSAPLYMTPPPYYAVPTPYYAPPPYAAPAAVEGCYAGPYVCPLEGPARVGMPCSCPTTQGRAWGSAR